MGCLNGATVTVETRESFLEVLQDILTLQVLLLLFPPVSRRHVQQGEPYVQIRDQMLRF